MTTQTIAEWLSDQLAKDEAAARVALAAHQQEPGSADHECFRNETWQRWASGDRVRVVSHCGCSTTENADDAERSRMAARALREVAAKRAILDLAEEASGWDMQVDTDRRVGRRDMEEEPYVGDLILRQLASVYPDCPEEWKP